MIKGVIFDMDGTLIDTEPIWRVAEIAAFEKVGIQLSAELLAKHTAGMRNDEVVNFWFNYFKYNKPENAIQVQQAILEGVIKGVQKEGKEKAMPGLDYIFNFFEERNIPMAVASSSPQDIIEITLESIGIAKYFEIKHSAEHETLGKPNPAVFISTAKMMNLKPENCLVFEDSLNGTLAAKSAKMKCVALPAAHDKEKAAFAIADKKLNSFLEFTENVFEELA